MSRRELKPATGNTIWDSLVISHVENVLGVNWRDHITDTADVFPTRIGYGQKEASWAIVERQKNSVEFPPNCGKRTLRVVSWLDGKLSNTPADAPSVVEYYGNGEIYATENIVRSVGCTTGYNTIYHSGGRIAIEAWLRDGALEDSEYGHPAHIRYNIYGKIESVNSTSNHSGSLERIPVRTAERRIAAANKRMKVSMAKSLCAEPVKIVALSAKNRKAETRPGIGELSAKNCPLF